MAITSREKREIVAKNTKLTIVNNMPAIISDIQQKLSRMTYAGATVLDGYQATNIPIDTSALANNRTIETKTIGAMRVVSILKFHQDYAAAVNAMPLDGNKDTVNWKRPSAIDHWLTKSGKESESEVLTVMNEVAKT